MTSLSASSNLDAFIDRCMEPLPDDVLIDTQLARILRKQRFRQWNDAIMKYKYCKAQLEVVRYNRTRNAAEKSSEVLSRIMNENEALEIMHAAHLALLLTPAAHKADVAWKRRQLDGYMAELFAGDIERVCKEDEAFFDAHPVSRRGKRRTCS